jgi:hypothetical protein
MRKTAKKFLCILLAFVLAFGAVTYEMEAYEVEEDKLQQALYIIPEGFSDIDFLVPNASYTLPETVNVEEAQARLQDFIEKFNGNQKTSSLGGYFNLFV